MRMELTDVRIIFFKVQHSEEDFPQVCGEAEKVCEKALETIF